ncbi:MAG: four helix bundle protein [Lentimicrobium sp.]|nr:four helix bundle protein [Lentimicrobium sp.]
MYRSFTEMPVWQKAHQLSIEIFKISSTLPRSEDYGLTSQIRRSSNSVPANIAEAFGRSTKKDKANFYIIARGSSYETQNHQLYGRKVGYFDELITERLFSEYSDLIYELNKIINAFAR